MLLFFVFFLKRILFLKNVHLCTQYQKYHANDAEELERYGLFKKSKARITKLNALNPEPIFGITSMSDRPPEEPGNVA